jgi:hypothetical protein
MEIRPDLGHSTSVGGWFPASSKWLALGPLKLLPDKEQVPAVCLKMGDEGKYILCRICLARLKKIAQLSGSPDHQNRQRKNDCAKLNAFI